MGQDRRRCTATKQKVAVMSAALLNRRRTMRSFVYVRQEHYSAPLPALLATFSTSATAQGEPVLFAAAALPAGLFVGAAIDNRIVVPRVRLRKATGLVDRRSRYTICH